jgi:hypothetical protein
VEIRDTYGLPDVHVVRLKEMFYIYPDELPPSDSEFFEQKN